MWIYSINVNLFTANTITVLFFTHSVIKFIYIALNSGKVYRTMGIWNQSNSHPLFAESDARYHSIALAKMRRLLVMTMSTTLLAVVGKLNHKWIVFEIKIFLHLAWTSITFFGESTKLVTDRNTNETSSVEIPRLPIKSWYPFNSMNGAGYYVAFGYQFYFLLFSMVQSTLADVLFCSWLLFACEQLQHLKVWLWQRINLFFNLI